MNARVVAVTVMSAFSLLAVNSHAAIFPCTIGNAFIDLMDDGRLAVNIIGTSSQSNMIVICNLASSTAAPGASVDHVTTETCKGWYNTLITAKALNKPVYAMFDTANTRAGSTGATSCDSMIA